MNKNAAKNSRGFIKIDLAAIRANIITLQKVAPQNACLLAVVKSDAYGHGAKRVATAIADMPGVYGFAVASCEEAFELREAGIKQPILVMGPVLAGDQERLIREHIAAVVYSMDSLQALLAGSERLGLVQSVHVKVDSGMARIGISADEQGLFIMRTLANSPNIHLEGIYSHFATADESNLDSTHKQLALFEGFVRQVEEELGLIIPHKHVANSAAILGFGDMDMDMVRPGIAIYGVWPSDVARARMPQITLKPALSFFSHIVMIKEVAAGEQVGYGATYVTRQKTTVATVPIGYGDGYPRSLSNCGQVLLRGKKAPIIGRVCMDFFMLDVSDIPEVAVGDTVTLLGTDGKHSMDAADLENLSGRFRYELLCGFTARIPRIYVDDN